MDDSDKSKIDNLKQILYSRKVKIRPNFVLDLNGHKTNVDEKWQTPSQPLSTPEADSGTTSDFSKKIFWGAFIFFVISLIIAGYVYFIGSNIISSNNIKIDVIGPTTIKAGEETVLDVSITNNNDTALQIADLVLEYPKGTRSAADRVTLMQHDRVAFGDIAPHETVRRTIRSVMYGEESKVASVKMTLEYRVSTAMSIFTKDTTYDVVVGSSPLTVSVEGLKEVNANQDYSLTVTIASNSTDIVRDALVIGELPFGFEVASTSPAPLPKTSVWNLGDIQPNGKKIITIKGKMYGDHNEDRYFKFTIGTKDQKIDTQISGIIATEETMVTIREPFIGIALDLGKNDNKSFVAKSGSDIDGLIKFRNNLDVPISDVAIEAKVNGSIVEQKSIKPTMGFFDSNTGIIKWNKFYNKDLTSVLPKSESLIAFTFNTLPYPEGDLAKSTNPQFVVDITVKGKRRLESGVPEEIISTVHRTVKVESEAHFTSQITHATGPIENEGSLPPRVGQKTEYTVTWVVTNTFNQLSGALVKTTLPDYVEWTGIVVGKGEKITYNKDSRELVWDIGSVQQQSGGQITSRQVSFQLGLLPSLSQIQTKPVMVNVANFSAHDTFTNTEIGEVNDVLTTELAADPEFKYEDSLVVPQQK